MSNKGQKRGSQDNAPLVHKNRHKQMLRSKERLLGHIEILAKIVSPKYLVDSLTAKIVRQLTSILLRKRKNYDKKAVVIEEKDLFIKPKNPYEMIESALQLILRPRQFEDVSATIGSLAEEYYEFVQKNPNRKGFWKWQAVMGHYIILRSVITGFVAGLFIDIKKVFKGLSS